MIKTFTQNDLLRYIYDEMENEESRELHNALLFDDDMAEAYHDFVVVKSQSEKVELEPSERVIKNIINYSKRFDSHTS